MIGHLDQNGDYMSSYFDVLVKTAEEQRKRNQDRMRRRMELGYDGWQKRDDGSFFKSTPKGIQHYYDTRTLVTLVNKAFDRNDGVCYINGRWQLQIRGKHLRRLLKAMPYVQQIGRTLVRKKK